MFAFPLINLIQKTLPRIRDQGVKEAWWWPARMCYPLADGSQHSSAVPVLSPVKQAILSQSLQLPWQPPGSPSEWVYNARWNKYVLWCKAYKLSPISGPVTKVLKFFDRLATKDGLA